MSKPKVLPRRRAAILKLFANGVEPTRIVGSDRPAPCYLCEKTSDQVFLVRLRKRTKPRRMMGERVVCLDCVEGRANEKNDPRHATETPDFEIGTPVLVGDERGTYVGRCGKRHIVQFPPPNQRAVFIEVSEFAIVLEAEEVAA